MGTVTTERPMPTGEGLTFEKVWAMFQESIRESDQRMRESDLRMRESDREWQKTRQIVNETSLQMKETDRQMKETDRIVKETSLQMKESDRNWKKTERFLDKLGKQMGDLHNNFGKMAEHMVAPSIAQKFNKLGYHFGTAASGAKILDEDGNIRTEIDLLMENGDCIIAVEVKTKAKIQDIEHHLKRLEILREHRNKYNDTRKISGGIAGVIFDNDAKQAAIEAGLYVIQQSGKTMMIEIPHGFIPREW